MKNWIFVLLIVLFSIVGMGQTGIQDSLKHRSSFDFSELSFVDAYDSMHATMSLRYPFTQWKAVNWNEKDSVTRPKILAAATNNDTVAFTSALFEYLYQIPDGHIELAGVSDQYKYQTVGGTYGFNMMKVDDGTVVVTYIPEESPAYEAGLRTNDRILKWNGIEINDVGNKEYLNYFRNYATEEGRMYSRYLMLGRDSIGREAEISFQSPQSKAETTISLIAFDDSMEMFYMGVFNTASQPNIDTLVSYKILESNVGYLEIKAEVCEGITPEEIMLCPDFLLVQEAIVYFNDNSIEDLIVDLRFNLGGNDLQAAVTMGLFFQHPSFYEYITASYDYDYEVLYSLWTEPVTPKYNGEIAVIVDPNCISTGEGAAMMLERAGATIISHWGTNGSFGMVDYDPVLMPAGLQVVFPQARSLDENYDIQLDTDSLMVGGVTPNMVVPLNDLNVYDQWVNFVDVQLEYALGHLLSDVEEENNSGCSLYPIPCNDIVNIEFSMPLVSECMLELFNNLGVVVLTYDLIPGSEDYIVNTSKLGAGVYFYRISVDGEILKGSIIVQR